MCIKESIQAYCKDKKIIVVGNGGSLLAEENGELIDDYGVVVRMNHGYPRKKLIQFTGQKTDIWICAYNNIARQYLEYKLFNPAYALRLNNDTHIHPKMKENFLLWDLQNWHRLKEDANILSYPSTGLVAIYFFLYYLQIPKITVTGFDFFQTTNFYQGKPKKNKIAKNWHNPYFEKIYILNLIEEKRIILL